MPLSHSDPAVAARHDPMRIATAALAGRWFTDNAAAIAQDRDAALAALAVVTVQCVTGNALAIAEDRDAAQAAVDLINVLLDCADQPDLRMSFDQFRAVLNACFYVAPLLPFRLRIDPVTSDEGMAAVDTFLRHRFDDEDWNDLFPHKRRAIKGRIELLRNAARNVALQRSLAAADACHG